MHVHAAGRNDLLNAIRMHGGFQVVADVLQRQRLFIRRPVVNDRDVILRKVCRVQQTLGLSPDEFPTREQFEACQMPQVVCWITSAGGFRKVCHLDVSGVHHSLSGCLGMHCPGCSCIFCIVGVFVVGVWESSHHLNMFPCF